MPAHRSADPRGLEQHDDLVRVVRELGSTTDVSVVSAHFVASLRSRAFEGWSTFVSYTVASTVPEHEFTREQYGRKCRICGAYKELDTYHGDLFERARATGSGLMIDSLRYTVYDLELFRAERAASAMPEDRAFFDDIILTILQLPGSATIKVADKAIKKYFSSSFDRGFFLGILGICGVMSAPSHPGLWPRFVDSKDRDVDPGLYTYPVYRWKREFGMRMDALEHFGLARFLSSETVRQLRRNPGRHEDPKPSVVPDRHENLVARAALEEPDIDALIDSDLAADWLAEFDTKPLLESLEDAIFLSDDSPDIDQSMICICAVVLLMFPRQLLNRGLISRETRDFLTFQCRGHYPRLAVLAGTSLSAIVADSELRDVRIASSSLEAWSHSMATLRRSVASRFPQPFSDKDL